MIMGFGWIFGVLLIVAIVWGVLRIAGAGQNRTGGMSHGGKALDLLKERYARGEIDQETFERMRQEIGY